MTTIQHLATIAAILLMNASSPGADVLTNGGFEQGTDSWHVIGPVSFEIDQDQPHAGCCCARLTNRTSEWNGIGQWVTDRLVPGRSYVISARVRLLNGTDELVTVKLRQVDEAGTRWLSLAEGRGRPGEWRVLKGAFTYEPVGTVDSLRYYVSGPEPGIDFLVDSLELVELDPYTREQTNLAIDAHRRRNVRVEVVDPSGCPIEGVALDMRQVSRAFAFGTAINRNHMDNQAYKDFIADHFEWGVMENAAKWRQNQPVPGTPDYEDADEIVDFCRENGITLRGHCITWANPIRVPDWVQPLQGDQLRTAVESRIDDVVTHFAEDFVHWDVNNEMIANSFFADRLGMPFRAEMFARARLRDPDVTLMVNDYNVITSNRQSALVQQAADLLELGADVGGLGAQGHFNAPPAPEVLMTRLDHLAESGLPIWITEYDCIVPDPVERADALEDNLRTAFSNPAVKGLLMWGFWEGSLWSGADAALVDLDWTVNPAGQRYLDLMDEWTTTASGTTDASGGFELRGIHGDYETIMELNGNIHERIFRLEAGDGVQLVTIVLEEPGECASCPGDIDGNGVIDGQDLSLLLGAWSTSDPLADLDGSGNVDGADLAILLSAWGACG